MAAETAPGVHAQHRRELPDLDPVARRLRIQESRGRLSETVADIEAQVVQALGLGQFSLLYQPRVSLRTGDVIAIEALLRWQDCTRGMLGPKTFLPHLAQTSAMVALGQWVLNEACSEAARWEAERPAGDAPVTLSVNVAAEEVLETGFVDGVRLALQERALPTTMLQLEVDAGDPLRTETLVSTRLQQLRDEGIRLAIDGASPLLGSGSARVEADSVHLQRRWVRALGGDAGVAARVASLVERVHRSGGTVCATGVEEREQADSLSALGCDHAQGYLYYEPVPADVLGWLGREQSGGEGRVHEQAPPPRLPVTPNDAVRGGRLPRRTPGAARHLPPQTGEAEGATPKNGP
jgi:EAL domain-containing protein (putative c-di-GMP-specific phosphodiesterase class I)